MIFKYNGNLIEEKKEYNLDGDLLAKTTFKYNENEDIVESESEKRGYRKFR
jgi:hypothetical protein